MSQNLFITYYAPGRPGLQVDDNLYTLTDDIPSLDWLLQNCSATSLREQLLNAQGNPVPAAESAPHLELGAQEVWAAGVTYKISEEARERESGNSTIYTRVYDAPRPELFIKALGYDAVSTGDAVGIRADANWSVPEPELTVVYNKDLEVVGFTIGNDMSSRDIEGDNPLYLPQAKVYDKSCALGPRIWVVPEPAEWPLLDIALTINRGGAVVFEGKTSTRELHRTLADLTDHLGRCKQFRHGALLLTGAGLVPPDDFTLHAGDEVHIRIDPIGTLVNTVTVVGQ